MANFLQLFLRKAGKNDTFPLYEPEAHASERLSSIDSLSRRTYKDQPRATKQPIEEKKLPSPLPTSIEKCYP